MGRKGVLVGSQLGLLVVGVAIGASPSYPALAVFKLLVGTFQQVRAPLKRRVHIGTVSSKCLRIDSLCG